MPKGIEFYEPILGRLMDLWALLYLNLFSNSFAKGFSSGIQNLQQLKGLDLHSNSLWGDVGVLFPELRNPEYVDLSGNSFYGQLFMDSKNLSSLANIARHLNLSRNKLTGGFFSVDSINLFKSLEVLDVGYNQISGSLPNFGSMPLLRVLRIWEQSFGWVSTASAFPKFNSVGGIGSQCEQTFRSCSRY